MQVRSVVCVAIGERTAEDMLALARREVAMGARLIELRLDCADDAADAGRVIDVLTRLRPDVQVLATCRRTIAGGQFDGTPHEQLDLLERAVEAGAWAVDIECETAEAVPGRVQALRSRARLLISHHDFGETPPLAPLMARLGRASADAYKLATFARTPHDADRLLLQLRVHQGPPLVAIAMGELGTVTRVLGPALGAPWTYVAPSGGTRTAPGQLTAPALRAAMAAAASESRLRAHRAATIVRGW